MNAPFIPTSIPTLDEVTAAAQESMVVAQGKIEEFVKAGQEQVQKSYDEAVAVAQEQVAKAQEEVTKVQAKFQAGYEELVAFSKANVEAVVASSTILVKGSEEFGKVVAELGKSSVEKYVEVSKAALSAKSPTEAGEIVQGYAKASYDTLVADIAKLQELLTKLTTEASAPIKARVEVAVELISKPVAL